MSIEELFAEALATSKAATAAMDRYVDALRSRDRAERASARESLAAARGVAAAAMGAYVDAQSARNAADLAAYLAR